MNDTAMYYKSCHEQPNKNQPEMIVNPKHDFRVVDIDDFSFANTDEYQLSGLKLYNISPNGNLTRPPLNTVYNLKSDFKDVKSEPIFEHDVVQLYKNAHGDYSLHHGIVLRDGNTFYISTHLPINEDKNSHFDAEIGFQQELNQDLICKYGVEVIGNIYTLYGLYTLMQATYETL